MKKSERGVLGIALTKSLRAILLSGCVAVFVIGAAPARAVESPSTPSEAADRFLEILDPNKTKGSMIVSPEITNPGYVYIKVEPIGKIGYAFAGKTCSEVFQQKSKTVANLYDNLFSKNYQLGLALRIPMRLRQGDVVIPKEITRIELPIFGLTKKSGENCRLQPGRLDRKDFRTPFIPIPTKASLDQYAIIELVPWAIKTEEPTRVNAFWSGLGTFASLLGPIGELGKKLFDGSNEKLTLRTQGKSAIESWLQLTPDGPPLAPFSEKEQVAADNWAVKISPEGTSAAAEWGFSLFIVNDTINPNKNIGFSAQIKYRKSRLYDTSAVPVFADSNTYKNFVERTNDIDGQYWSQISPDVINLSNQNDPGRFSTLCQSAVDDLKKLEFSDSDIALLIFAIARAKMSVDKIGQITCLRLSPLPRLKETLQDLNISLPIAPLPKTEKKDWDDVFEAARKSLNTPTKPDLSDMLGSSVLVGGKPELLLESNSSPWLQGVVLDGITLTQLKAKLQVIKGGSIVRCMVDSTSTSLPFKLPKGVPGEIDDRAIAFILDQKTSAAIVLLGLAGRTEDTEANPQISNIWIGQPKDFLPPDDDTIMADVLMQMKSLLSTGQRDCKGSQVNMLLNTPAIVTLLPATEPIGSSPAEQNPEIPN